MSIAELFFVFFTLDALVELLALSAPLLLLAPDRLVLLLPLFDALELFASLEALEAFLELFFAFVAFVAFDEFFAIVFTSKFLIHRIHIVNENSIHTVVNFIFKMASIRFAHHCVN